MPADGSRNFSEASSSAHQFKEFFIRTPRFNLTISRLTNNTYVLAVLPPGEAELNCTRINIATARQEFAGFDPPIDRGGVRNDLEGNE
jgi:hypothetical protein